MPGDEANVKGIPYSFSAKIFGNFISILPISAIPWCAFRQMKKHDYSLNSLLNPEDRYYNKYRKFLRDKNKVVRFLGN